MCHLQVIYMTELLANLVLGKQDTLAREIQEGRALKEGQGALALLR